MRKHGLKTDFLFADLSVLIRSFAVANELNQRLILSIVKGWFELHPVRAVCSF